MERVHKPAGGDEVRAADAPSGDGMLQTGPLVSSAAAPRTPRAASPCVSCGLSADSDLCAHCGCARAAGDYRIVKVLAQSDRGRVYEAVRGDGARAALKELVFATVPGAQQLEQFHREARVLRELRHPRIPRFIDAFETGAGVHTRLFLAQEFVDGESLLERLRAGRFDEQEARQVAAQVLEILDHLHGLTPRLIHRDIKPANLLLRRDGTVALVDFDAARALVAQRTHGASIAGTFGYMPLEQLGGTVDATSDLYALGATLIHLLSGRDPHELLGRELQLEFAAHVQVSPAFSAWLEKMVARAHGDRFPSAREALRALDAPAPTASAPLEPAVHRASGPVRRVLVTRAERLGWMLGRLVRRGPSARTALVLTGLALLASGIFLVVSR